MKRDDFPTINQFSKDEQEVLRKYFYVSKDGYIFKACQDLLEDYLDDEPMDTEDIQEELQEYKNIMRLGYGISVWIEYVWEAYDHYYYRLDRFFDDYDSEGDYYNQLCEMRKIADWYEEKHQLTDDWDSDFVKRFQTDNQYVYFECYKNNWL